MPTERTKIIAIDPGTKELGISVLYDEELVYYAVKTIRDRQSPGEVLRQAREEFIRIVDDYMPDYLAIEKMFLIHKSAALLNVVAEEIKAVAKNKGLNVYEQPPAVVRKIICQTGRATKREAAERVAARYPELVRYLDRKSKWEQLYYANMFDAIAVGLCCLQEIKTKARSRGQNIP